MWITFSSQRDSVYALNNTRLRGGVLVSIVPDVAMIISIEHIAEKRDRTTGDIVV
jgi:hypothetical protein